MQQKIKFKAFEVTISQGGEHNSYAGNAIIAGHSKDSVGYNDQINKIATELLKAENQVLGSAIQFKGLQTHLQVKTETIRELLRYVYATKKMFEDKRKLVKQMLTVNDMIATERRLDG